MDQKVEQKLESSQHVSNLKFKQLNEKLDSMCNDIKEDIHDIIIEIKQYRNEPPNRDERGRFKKRDNL